MKQRKLKSNQVGNKLKVKLIKTDPLDSTNWTQNSSTLTPSLINLGKAMHPETGFSQTNKCYYINIEIIMDALVIFSKI